ncbi:MAG TPA: MarR family transcriptional regulator [Roseomonas sp.]|jgi:MarR family transcriptional regulator for hemolysin
MQDETQDRLRLTSSLILAGRQWRRLAETALAAHDISEARAAPLVWLARLGDGVNQVTLASHIGIEGTSLVRLLDQLGAAGLIERRDDPGDRRAKTIWLTQAGRDAARQIEQVLTELRARILGDIGAADIQATLRVLRAVQDAAAAEGAA